MNTLNKIMLCCALGSLATTSFSYNNNYEQHNYSQSATFILNNTTLNDQVKYINFSSFNQEDLNYKTFKSIKDDILSNDSVYWIDFTDSITQNGKQLNNKKVKKLLGMAYQEDMLLISSYKGKLLYTPFNASNNTLFPQLINQLLNNSHTPKKRITRDVSAANPLGDSSTSDDKKAPPNVSFYINVFRPISDEECTFKRSHLWDRGNEVFCDNANISLVYRITWQRSLKYGASGLDTPDAKIVRISLDEQSAGAGIHLNDKLDHRENKAGYVPLNAFVRDWSTDVYAQYYNFTVKALNNKAVILKTFPTTNINANFTQRHISSFEIGVTGGAEWKLGHNPQAKLEASYKYSQSRWLSFDTQDYAVKKSNPSNNQVSFKWEREQYATPDSLFDDWTDALWAVSYPIDKTRIRPIGYSNFTPNFDIIYKASPTATGTTTIDITSSVLMRSVYASAYQHYYVIGGHASYKPVHVENKEITITKSFDVDWEHPVFLGGYPVNLQLAGFNNKCLSQDSAGYVQIEQCDLDSTVQSFIYDSLGRYVSASNTSLCLDGYSLHRLTQCDSRLSQRWTWQQNQLINTANNGVLSHNTSTSALYLANTPQSANNHKIITSFTNVFALTPQDQTSQPSRSTYCNESFSRNTGSAYELVPCEPVKNLSSTGYQSFFVQIPYDYEGNQLEVSLHGGNGNADLYINKGSWPWHDHPTDYKSINTGNNEQIIIPNPEKGATYYIEVHANTHYEGVMIEARL
ncbi:leukocidin family pore-forming toxin [Zooshikella harenae]|uniref:Leukocidin family pore-forming toxin n=1 Tax=Zooshikella harenae TaxID=2827238 RepID=A0ABS5ZAI9_9GAMM|nr:leukocidin family pore-forming toxin [Zooshikella harenae]MBU2711067.1 leukocidin family pore-forming toxin [Zooshikella harenae]